MMTMLKCLAVLSVFCALSCSKASNPVAPTPVVLACVTNNTAEYFFRNTSSGTTMDIVWDGIRLAISPVGPGMTVGPITTAAGVAHTAQFRITNSSWLACSTAYPVPTQCATSTLTCGG